MEKPDELTAEQQEKLKAALRRMAKSVPRLAESLSRVSKSARMAGAKLAEAQRAITGAMTQKKR